MKQVYASKCKIGADDILRINEMEPPDSDLSRQIQ